jgi:hypothetical protein
MKYFNPLWFFIGFAVGMLIVYVMPMNNRLVYKHPMPDNVDKVVYHDKANNCYKYLAEEIKCPADPNQSVNHPLVLSQD